MRHRNRLLVRPLVCATFAVLSLAVVACGDDAGGSSAPEDAATKAFENIADSDWEGICSSSTEEAQQQYILMAQARQQVAELGCAEAAALALPLTEAQQEMAGTADIGEVNKSEGERASVSVDFESGPSGSVFLSKVDGKWMLSGLPTAPPEPQVDLTKDKSSLYLAANRPVVKAVEDFFGALADQDAARVCTTVIYSDEAAEKGTCEKRYAALIKDMKKDRSLRDAAAVKVTDAGVDEGIASAAVTFGTASSVPVQLGKDGDQWKVVSFVRPAEQQTTTSPTPAP